MHVEDFVYQLPQKLIARYPTKARAQSRLLCLDDQGQIEHRLFHSFPDLLNPGDLLVLNDTRVIPARLYGTHFNGNKVEIAIEQIVGKHEVKALIHCSKTIKPDHHIRLDSGEVIQVVRQEGAFYRLKFNVDETVNDVLNRHGHMPLPPYLQRKDEGSDKDRFQTVYAQESGSVGAPVAGLHFDKKMLEDIQNSGVELGYITLHVGSQTFPPVRRSLQEHRMVKEYARVSEKLCRQVKATRERRGRVIAIGTTTARCLETAAVSGTIRPYEGETDLFIYPGYSFRVVDGLLTNFHLPGSPTLMLVCAFVGRQQVLEAYRVAVENRYRFYCYGDVMFYLRPIK